MATTNHWYINPDGGKADFTDPSADINAAGQTVTRELRKVSTIEGGTSTHPLVQLWKAAGSRISTAEIAAAIVDQDSAAVPVLQQASDPASVGSPAHAAIADITAIATVDGSDPATTQALANATKAKVNTIITAVNAVLATLRGQGEVAP